VDQLGVLFGPGVAGAHRPLVAGLRAVLDGRLPSFEQDYEITDAGRRWWFQAQIVPLRGRPGAIVSHVEITDRKRTEHELSRQATHDPLTGLLNREGLRRRLDAVFAGGLAMSPSLLFVDLDGFKAINDALGHGAGDEVLVEVTRRLRQVAPEAVIARMGGDEFAVLLTYSSHPRAGLVAARVVAALREPVDVQGLSLTISASVGVAVADSSHAGASDLQRDADAAMYAAKEGGRDRYALFDAALRSRAMRRVRMLDRLRHAVARPAQSGLSLEYQVIRCLTAQDTVGLEALARWDDDVLGAVAPVEFVRAAEESGLILRLGAWALEQACCTVVSAPGQPQVSVNLSPRQLADPGLVGVVDRVLEQSGLAPDRLCLEITESAVVADVGQAVRRLHALRERGILIALDDFGTGWSSLGQLHRLPIDRIKVDRSFVAALGSNADDGPATAVIRAVVALAHGLGMLVTAEGVETAEQLERLAELGCDGVQGFFIGRPASAAELGLFPPTTRPGVPGA
jgi:diguanylate cyclase (GGDEF)-like protein